MAINENARYMVAKANRECEDRDYDVRFRVFGDAHGDQVETQVIYNVDELEAVIYPVAMIDDQNYDEPHTDVVILIWRNYGEEVVVDTVVLKDRDDKPFARVIPSSIKIAH